MVEPPTPPFDIAIVSYNTDAYLLRLIRSIAAVLSARDVAGVHVWDNGSVDHSLRVLQELAAEYPWLHVHRSAANIHHGPALDALLKTCCTSRWVLLLDSDTEVLRDFVPDLPPLGQSRDVVVGQVSPWAAPLYFYLAHLLIDRSAYGQLPPFVDDGAPGVELFRAIHTDRLRFCRFRWCDHIAHAGQTSLRGVYGRGETENPLYAFAKSEVRSRPDSRARAQHEARLRTELDTFLRGRWPGAATVRSRAGSGEGQSTETTRGTLAAGYARRHWWSSRAVSFRSVRRRRLLDRAARFGITQDPDEVMALHAIVRRDRPRRVLEIGNAHGGSLFLWSHAAASDAVLVHLDAPLWEPDDPREPDMRRRLEDLVRRTQVGYVLRGDPGLPGARLAVEQRLAGDRLDFLFLTRAGDAAQTRVEYDTYAPLVGPGGLIAVQGIVSAAEGRRPGPSDVWREIAAGGDAVELVRRSPRPGFGIGVIRVP